MTAARVVSGSSSNWVRQSCRTVKGVNSGFEASNEAMSEPCPLGVCASTVSVSSPAFQEAPEKRIVVRCCNSSSIEVRGGLARQVRSLCEAMFVGGVGLEFGDLCRAGEKLLGIFYPLELGLLSCFKNRADGVRIRLGAGQRGQSCGELSGLGNRCGLRDRYARGTRA